MSENYKFKQGQMVLFNNGVLRGCGWIKGCATTGHPIIGKMYIVEAADGSVPTKTYPFNTFTVAECHLETA